MVKITAYRSRRSQALNKPTTAAAAAATDSNEGSDAGSHTSSRAGSHAGSHSGSYGSSYGSPPAASLSNRSLPSARALESGACGKDDPVQAVSHSWPPYKSVLAAVLRDELDYIKISKGSNVMYVGCASVAVSQLADMVGKSGNVYAIESGAWVSGELLDLGKRLRNVVAIGEDPLMPYKYHRLVDSVDFLFCDTLHYEQVRILILHARHFLRPGGRFTITLPGTPQDCNKVVQQLHAEQLETLDRVSLQPHMRSQTIAVGVYNLTVPEFLSEACQAKQ